MTVTVLRHAVLQSLLVRTGGRVVPPLIAVGYAVPLYASLQLFPPRRPVSPCILPSSTCGTLGFRGLHPLRRLRGYTRTDPVDGARGPSVLILPRRILNFF